ncbi:hypothetical protein Leryth_015327 [Lithospermum erythrorhizon]|nr:hypothetical protein Leryth_015327 [Lithospermum erythrorhizon]
MKSGFVIFHDLDSLTFFFQCNKDEAIRGKDMAVKKMENNDFEGARRIAMKAQQLFPELENINQLLTFSSRNCRQTTSTPSVIQGTFWTACPFCKTKFQYLRKHVNLVVNCQRCTKNLRAALKAFLKKHLM